MPRGMQRLERSVYLTQDIMMELMEAEKIVLTQGVSGPCI